MALPRQEPTCIKNGHEKPVQAHTDGCREHWQRRMYASVDRQGVPPKLLSCPVLKDLLQSKGALCESILQKEVNIIQAMSCI
jgi:hypothetical protein